MNGLVDFARLRYAVIEALRTEADPERFVISYRTEQSLHNVIAAPCIIAFGFFSREEAEASINVLRLGYGRLETITERMRCR